MDQQSIAVLALGYALQWAKGFKKLPTWAAQLVTAALVAGAYALFVEVPTAAHWREWVQQVIAWGLMAIGTASVAGAAGLAPKTDSIH